MIAEKLSITKFQLFFVLIQTQIGIGLLSLPNVVQKSAKGDGWISIILAGVVIQGLLVVYYKLLKKFPNNTLTNITQKILGRSFGKVVNYIIYFNFILTGSIATILMVKIINLNLLPLTPGWIISLLIIIPCIYLTISDLRIIARFFVLVSGLIILLLMITILAFFIPKEIQFILPIGSAGVKNILIGSNSALFSMLGFEMLLFVFPYVIRNTTGVLKTISLANLFVTSFYTFITFLCLITFSPDQLQQLREPVIYLFRGLSYKMIDRIDLIFFSIWIVPMTTSIIAYLFLASKSISEDKKFNKKVVVINGILIFLISLIPHTDEITTILNKYVSYLSYAIVIALPVILLILSFIFKRNERGETT
ncbi:GerAB/ArcD/ProY family transporter [Paenisporosarcina sp.]|uniref:GerAB/ArcD/ProY family transporter n=1 Tax=Paenisporosarcina sp. TaxID=1932001 RepID=UPI003C72F6ED